jgi:hypothetical protein
MYAKGKNDAEPLNVEIQTKTGKTIATFECLTLFDLEAIRSGINSDIPIFIKVKDFKLYIGSLVIVAT